MIWPYLAALCLPVDIWFIARGPTVTVVLASLSLVAYGLAIAERTRS